MRHAGARTFGQNEKTCVVYGMPRVAHELGAVETQLPLNSIGEEILKSSRRPKRRKRIMSLAEKIKVLIVDDQVTSRLC